MALIHDIENLMHTFNTNSDVPNKVKTYEKIQECILQKSDQLSANVKDELVSLITLHLRNENIDVRKSALATWVLLLRTFKSITNDFVKIIYGDIKDINVDESIIPLYSFLIKEDCLESLAILLKHVDSNAREQMLQSFFRASEDVPTEIYYKFILNNVVNGVFMGDDNDVRRKLLKFALFTKDKYPLVSLPRDKQKEVANTFKGRYLPVIESLRQQNNLIFYELSIFVMNYCGKLLHSEIEFTNSILRNIEAGFKTRTVDDRLMAYECWKVLIDNCSLDRDYLYSNKQLKLLVKPLKIKLSKHDQVVCKRFEVWSHLMEALQQKAIIYITEYLEYCFGPLSPNKIEDIAPINNEVIKTWPKRTDILMKLIGHFGHNRSCVSSENFKFDKPIVTASNFVNYDYLIINSIGICCERLLQWEEKNSRDVKVKCLWGSLFNIIKTTDDKHKETVLQKVFVQIKHLLTKSVLQAEYFDDIVKHVLEVFVSFKEPICDIAVINQIITFPLLEVLLPQSCLSTEKFVSITNFINYNIKVNNKLLYFDKVCVLLKSCQHKKKECALSLEVWLQFADVLFAICKTPRDSFQEFEENAKFFMSWIVKFIFPHSSNDKILDTWKNILLEISAISSLFKESLLRECEIIVKENPDLTVTVVDFLPIFVQLLSDDKGSQGYVTLLLSVTSECLKNPCMPKTKVVSVVSVVKKIVEIISKYDTNIDLVLGKLCCCVTNILQPHQVFEILPVLKSYFSKINEAVKQNLHNSLHKVISELITNSNTSVAKDAAYLLGQLEKPSKQKTSLFTQPALSNRGARIANMAAGNVNTSPSNVLRLFGRDIETSSPVRVRGSQIGRASPSSRALKIANAMPTFSKGNKNIESDDKEFVVISKEVKIDKSKMSKHQREMMRKRRDDIPALYQDLTQSQSSNTMEFSDNSLSLNKTDDISDAINELNKEVAPGGVDLKVAEENKPNDKQEDSECKNDVSHEALKSKEFQEILEIAMKKSKSLSPDKNTPIKIGDCQVEKVLVIKQVDLPKLSDLMIESAKSNLDVQSEVAVSEAILKSDLDILPSTFDSNFEVLDFGASSESQEIVKEDNIIQTQETDIIDSFGGNSVCLDDKFLAADLFVGFNQNVSLESENNDEFNSLVPSKSKDIIGDTFDGDERDNANGDHMKLTQKSRTTMDLQDSIKSQVEQDLDVFDFVSSEIDEIEQSSDIDNLLHDLRKSPVKRHRRSLSYDGSQSIDVEQDSTCKNRNLRRMRGGKRRNAVLLKTRKIRNVRSRFKRTVEETRKQQLSKPSDPLDVSKPEGDDEKGRSSGGSSPESSSKKLKKSFKIIPITKEEESKNPEQIKLRISISKDDDIGGSLINECPILKQLDDEILKIDKNLKENSDIVGGATPFTDVLLIPETFEDIEKFTTTESIVPEHFDKNTFESILPCSNLEASVDSSQLIDDIAVVEVIKEATNELDLKKSDNKTKVNHEPAQSVEVIEIEDSNDGFDCVITTEAQSEIVVTNTISKEKESDLKADSHSEDIFESGSTILKINPVEAKTSQKDAEDVYCFKDDSPSEEITLSLKSNKSGLQIKKLKTTGSENDCSKETNTKQLTTNDRPNDEDNLATKRFEKADKLSNQIDDGNQIDEELKKKEPTNVSKAAQKIEKETAKILETETVDLTGEDSKELDTLAESTEKTPSETLPPDHQGYVQTESNVVVSNEVLADESQDGMSNVFESPLEATNTIEIPKVASRRKRVFKRTPTNATEELLMPLIRKRRTRLVEKLEKSFLDSSRLSEPDDKEASTSTLKISEPEEKQEDLETSELHHPILFEEHPVEPTVAKTAKAKRSRPPTKKTEKPAVFVEPESKEFSKKKDAADTSDKLDEEIRERINKFLDSLSGDTTDIFGGKKSVQARSAKKDESKVVKKFETRRSRTRSAAEKHKALLNTVESDVGSGKRSLKSREGHVDDKSMSKRFRKSVDDEIAQSFRTEKTKNIKASESRRSKMHDLLKVFGGINDDFSYDDEETNIYEVPQVRRTSSRQRTQAIIPRKRSRLSLVRTAKVRNTQLTEEDHESEDIIESSQMSPVHCESILTKSRQKIDSPKSLGESSKNIFKTKSEQLNSEIKEVVNSITKNRNLKLTLGESLNENETDMETVMEDADMDDEGFLRLPKFDNKEKRKSSKIRDNSDSDSEISLSSLKKTMNLDLHAKDTETCDPNENIDIDHLITKQQSSQSTGLIGNMNIGSLPIGFETPKKGENIPGSPVCDDTPIRNSELLINTSNISPIKIDINAATQEKGDLTVNVGVPKISKPLKPLNEIIKHPSSRSAKLLNLLPGSSSVPLRLSKPSVVKKFDAIRISSPSTERIRKMMMNCGEKVKPPVYDNESDSEVIENDILAFTREIPSPLAAPNSSILKRKAEAIEDVSLLPNPKRKRVNFSDPPTTSQKIFFKEEDENKPNFKKSFKKVPAKPKTGDELEKDGSTETSFSLISGLNLMKAEPIYPQLTSCNNDIKEITTILEKDSLLEQFHSVNVLTVGDLAKLNDAQVNQLEFLESPRLIKIMDALEAFYSSYAEDDDETRTSDDIEDGTEVVSIFPELVGCTDSIQNILKLFSTIKTAREFRKKNISTVGDLAKMSKNEIYELSIRIPKISHVMHALTIHYRKFRKEQKHREELDEMSTVEDPLVLGDEYLSSELADELNRSDAETQTSDNDDVASAITDDERKNIEQTNEVPKTEPTAAHPLEKLSRKDLIEFIKNRYSFDEVKDFCDTLLKDDI